MGVKTSGKNHPLKVRLNSLSQQRFLLINSRKLHNLDQFSHIYINPDLSYKEWQVLRELRQELQGERLQVKRTFPYIDARLWWRPVQHTILCLMIQMFPWRNPPSTDRVNRTPTSAPHQSSWCIIILLWWFGGIKNILYKYWSIFEQKRWKNGHCWQWTWHYFNYWNFTKIWL